MALHEEVNRMNSGALAIVFAPCILRTNKVVPAQDSLHDIGRQTACIETIIEEQLSKVRATLADIDTLDTACHTASNRLSSIRSSKVCFLSDRNYFYKIIVRIMNIWFYKMFGFVIITVGQTNLGLLT